MNRTFRTKSFHGCNRPRNGQGKEKFFKDGKVGEIYFESGKIDILKISQGKLKYFNTADIVPLKGRRNSRGHCDLNDIFWLMKKKVSLHFLETFVFPQQGTRNGNT